MKLEGLPLALVHEAIIQGTKGHHKILDIMDKTLAEPRDTRKANGPILEDVNISQQAMKALLRYGGFHMKRLTTETGMN